MLFRLVFKKKHPSINRGWDLPIPSQTPNLHLLWAPVWLAFRIPDGINPQHHLPHSASLVSSDRPVNLLLFSDIFMLWCAKNQLLMIDLINFNRGRVVGIRKMKWRCQQTGKMMCDWNKIFKGQKARKMCEEMDQEESTSAPATAALNRALGILEKESEKVPAWLRYESRSELN